MRQTRQESSKYVRPPVPVIHCGFLTSETVAVPWINDGAIREVFDFLIATQHKIFNTPSTETAVWPDWAIYWTLVNFLNCLATIMLHKSHTFLVNFCKVVKINHFSTDIIFRQLLKTFGDFFLVTLTVSNFHTFRWELLSTWATYTQNWW